MSAVRRGRTERLFYYSKNAHRADAFKLLGGNYLAPAREPGRADDDAGRSEANIRPARSAPHAFVCAVNTGGKGAGAKSRRRERNGAAYGRERRGPSSRAQLGMPETTMVYYHHHRCRRRQPAVCDAPGNNGQRWTLRPLTSLLETRRRNSRH